MPVPMCTRQVSTHLNMAAVDNYWEWVSWPEKCAENEDIHEFSRRNPVYEFSVNISLLTLNIFNSIGTFGSGEFVTGLKFFDMMGVDSIVLAVKIMNNGERDVFSFSFCSLSFPDALIACSCLQRLTSGFQNHHYKKFIDMDIKTNTSAAKVYLMCQLCQSHFFIKRSRITFDDLESSWVVLDQIKFSQVIFSCIISKPGL